MQQYITDTWHLMGDETRKTTVCVCMVEGYMPRKGVVGRITAPQDAHVLIPGTGECVNLCGKGTEGFTWN